MWWPPLLLDGSHSQELVFAVATPHDRAQQLATAMVFRCFGLHGHCAQTDSVLWYAIQMQWMHHGAQLARAVAALLVAAAEALCIRRGCTLVQRMAVAMRWLPSLVDGSRLQQLVLAVATPHDRAQQPATAMVFRCCGLHGQCAQSDSLLWCATWMQ